MVDSQGTIDTPVNLSSCPEEAFRLKELHDGTGAVFHVWKAGHVYYIPEGSQDESFALNHTDNGYDRFPQMTVGEVKKWGRELKGVSYSDYLRRRREQKEK